MPEFITAYGPKIKKSLDFTGTLSMTKQAFKAESDINNVIAKYDKTGLISNVNASVAQYGDFTQVNEYQESLNRVLAAQDAFNSLPSKIREKFANDPGTFFEFATNPKNADAMVELGLAEKRMPDPLITAVQQVTAAVQASTTTQGQNLS